VLEEPLTGAGREKAIAAKAASTRAMAKGRRRKRNLQ
jgi:hypothetical protein